MPSSRLPLVLVALASFTAGCVPYAVGTTAATTPVRTVAPSAVVQIASADRVLDAGDRASGAVAVLGNEARLGLSPRSDVGVRLLGLGSLVASYKRRLSGTGDAGAALLVGAGVIGAERVHGEATLVVSLPVRGRVVPYGGVRVQAMHAFAGDALDTPAAVGVFGGGRFGWPDLALSPEVGVFYSPSPLTLDRTVIVVPSLTVHGDRLMRALGL